MKPLIVHPQEEHPYIISFFSSSPYSFTCPHVMFQPSNTRTRTFQPPKINKSLFALTKPSFFSFLPIFCFFFFISTFLREFASITDLRIYYLKYSTVFISVCFGYIITCDRVKHANIFDLADTSTHAHTHTRTWWPQISVLCAHRDPRYVPYANHIIYNDMNEQHA